MSPLKTHSSFSLISKANIKLEKDTCQSSVSEFEIEIPEKHKNKKANAQKSSNTPARICIDQPQTKTTRRNFIRRKSTVQKQLEDSKANVIKSRFQTIEGTASKNQRFKSAPRMRPKKQITCFGILGVDKIVDETAYAS